MEGVFIAMSRTLHTTRTQGIEPSVPISLMVACVFNLGRSLLRVCDGDSECADGDGVALCLPPRHEASLGGVPKCALQPYSALSSCLPESLVKVIESLAALLHATRLLCGVPERVLHSAHVLRSCLPSSIIVSAAEIQADPANSSV